MKLLLASLVLAAFVCTQLVSTGNRLIRPKIFGGQEAKPGQFPYQAGLVIDDFNFCGATIIHESYVLTAASWAYDGHTFTVYVGSITQERDASPKQSLISHEAIMHENYEPNGFNYDIALIRLPYSLTFDGGELSPTLLYAEVKIITNEDCKAIYWDVITDSHICTLPKDNDGICKGDFGGPLISTYRVGEREIEKAVTGISSFISSRGGAVGPDGYTRVYNFIDWINSHME